MYKRIATVVAMLSMGLNAQAAGIDASLSDESAYFNFLFDSSRVVQGGADISLGFFYNDKEEQGVEYDAFMGTGEFMVTGNMKGSQKRVTVGAGAKAYLGTVDDISDTDISAAAVGAKVAYIIPNESTPMSLYLKAFVAPGITSFGDTDQMHEWTVGFDAELAPSARGYIGYREIETEFEKYNGDVELDDNFHVGIAITF
ncbi:MAG: YfaZ family outer membrane protein [Pseudomonadota bacterium]